MFELHPVPSLDLPALAPYRTMRRPQEHREQGFFVAEGDKVVERLLESALEVVSLLLPEDRAADFMALAARRRETIPIFTAPKRLLEELTGFELYQGILAVGRIPAACTAAQCLARAPQPVLLAAVDAVSSAQNLGGVVRNCAAFGGHGLLCSANSCSPYLRRAVRASMGAVFKLPVVQTDSLPEQLAVLRAGGVRCIAAHPHSGRTLREADLRGGCCLVFGSEGSGITPEVLAACDEAVAAPMAQEIDSLNVSAASAVFFYEAWRQRNAGSS